VKKGIMERLVNISMDLFKYSAFIGAFTLESSLPWAGHPVQSLWSSRWLIWFISQNVTPLAGGMMLFVFGVGHGVPVIPIATFSRAVGGQIGEKYIYAGKWATKAFGLAVIVIGLIYAVRYFGFKLW
jgi:cytochrome c-type biogenesis protein